MERTIRTLSRKGDQEDEMDLRQGAWAAEGSSGIEPGSTTPDIRGDQKTQKVLKNKGHRQTLG